MSAVPPRTVAVIGAVCLTAGWLLASTLIPPVAQVQTLPARPASAPAVEEQAFTEQLRLRLQHIPAAPTPRRNPFVFGDRPRPDTFTAGRPSEPTAAPVVTPAPVAVGPVYTLAGIGIDGDVRTAILAEADNVHILKVGERLGGYDVVEITENSVTLAESTGLRWVLRLR